MADNNNRVSFPCRQIQENSLSQVQWLTPVVPALGRPRQVDPTIKSSLGCIARLSFKNTNKNTTLNKPKKKKIQFLLILLSTCPDLFCELCLLYVDLSVPYYSDDNLRDISLVNARISFYLLASIPILESFDLSPFLFTQKQATGFKCRILT